MIDLFRTSTFRLALLYFGLFATSVLAVLSLVYWQTVIYADQQTGETIDAEITGLAEQYHQRGLGGLIQVIADRSEPGRGGGMLYLLTDSGQRPLAGNLNRWPDVTVEPDGWMRFPMQSTDAHGVTQHVAQATSFLLAGGYQLLVGRDLAERAALTQRVVTALIWAAALTLMLGLVGGILMSRRVLARIEAINRSADLVMAGDLGRRIPARPGGDEFDRLARNLNAMLERIEILMNGIRQVSDNIAHDLRSPLGRLRGRLEMALRQPRIDIEEYQQVLGAAIGDADQLLATFTALLDIASAEAGSMDAEMSPIDVAAMLRGLGDFYEPVADEAGLTLVAEIGGGSLNVLGNRHLLSRAVANLIDNAVKYTPSPGRIEIRAVREESAVRIEVSDSGPGIPAESHGQVFERFVRLENSRTSPGNGLGLSLVRAIISLHGGSISLENNDPGLRVIISIPLGGPPATLGDHRSGSAAKTHSLTSMNAMAPILCQKAP